MGQSESTAVNDENVTHLPIKKENALKNILFVDESNDLSKDTLTTKLKKHLKCLGPECSEAFYNYILKLSEEKSSSNCKLSYVVCIIRTISEIIAQCDSINGCAKFIINTFSHCNQEPSKSNIETFLEGLVTALSVHDSNTILQSETTTYFKEKLNKLPNDSISVCDIDDLLTKFPYFYHVVHLSISMLFFHKDKEIISNLLPQIDLQTSQPTNFAPLISQVDLAFLAYNMEGNDHPTWRLLFSSHLHGESFTKMSTSMVDQGPLLVVVRDRNGHVFGGYTSTNLQFKSIWQGDGNSFLFKLKPNMDCWHAKSYNDHFVYMNINQSTMPNGFGMGGQHGYFGLFLSDNFGQGHSWAKPKNTTFGSPQLSHGNHEFKLDRVEVWGVGEAPKNSDDEEDEESQTRDTSAKALLQVMGHEFRGDAFRDPDCS